jgi:hypothetical protein
MACNRRGEEDRMAKVKGSKKLYGRMRDSGVRKKVARQLAVLPGVASDGKRPPKPVRDAVERLEGVVDELQRHASRGDRKAAARKGARTKRAKAERRSRSAKRGAKARS